MKPQMLKIVGINNFNDVQEIDFTKILDKGIFGIFGDTGSGKSTIIDAITLALYGKIVRYNGQGNTNGEFINLNRTDASVELIFSIKDGKDEVFYEIIRKFKKNAKGDIKLSLVRFSLLNGEEKVILSDKKKDIDNKIIDIVGLGYEDFTKAVVLPQGKFSEFLMLKDDKKREMLQRIFSLEKYGEKLKNKINERKNIKEKEVYELKVKLDNIGDISYEKIEQDEKELNDKKISLDEINKKIKLKREEEKIYTKILDIKKDYTLYKEKLDGLYIHKHTFEEFQNLLSLAQESEKIYSHILEKEDLKEKSISIDKEIKSLKIDFDNITNQFETINKDLIISKEENEKNIPKLQKLKEDIFQQIDILKQIDEKQKQLIDIEKEKDILKQEKQDITKNLNILDEQKQSLSKEIEKISKFNKENKVDLSLKQAFKIALDVKNDNINLENQLSKLKASYKKNTSEIKNIEKDKQKNKIALEKEKEILTKVVNNNILEFKEKIDINQKNIENILNQNEDLKDNIKKIDMQIKLQDNNKFMFELAKNLKHNEKCPLCGSKEHPDIFEIVSDAFQNTLLIEKEEKEELLQKNIVDINKLKTEIELLNKTISDISRFSLKYNIEKSELISKEFVYNQDNVLEQIYFLDEKINKYIKLDENFDINIANIEKDNKKILDEENNILEKLKDNNKKYNDLNLACKEDVIQEEYDKILVLDEKIIQNKDKLLELNKKIEENSMLYIQENEKLNSIDKKELSINLNIKEISTYIEELRRKLIDLDNIEDYDKELEKINNEIENISNKNIILQNQFEIILEKKKEIENLLNECIVKQNINKENILRKEQYINDFLKNSIFDNEEDIKMGYKPKEKQEYYKEKIKSYTDKMSDYKNNLSRLEKELENIDLLDSMEKNITNFDEKYLEDKKNHLEKDLECLEEKNKMLIEGITKLEVKIKQDKEKMDSIKDISLVLKEEQNKLDILKELSDINKGGVFIEYVANRQLKHIVIDASKRLSYMSQNKYSLELVDNNFYIKDNYNAGIMRSPKSLSGGELFMASLSLALALSSKIQLKNKSPLEVFFLDEGFGTLDASSLDTVINTLEQLQTNNISVGIITHIEDIKNRVQNKIILTNTNTGSKIKIV